MPCDHYRCHVDKMRLATTTIAITATATATTTPRQYWALLAANGLLLIVLALLFFARSLELSNTSEEHGRIASHTRLWDDAFIVWAPSSTSGPLLTHHGVETLRVGYEASTATPLLMRAFGSQHNAGRHAAGPGDVIFVSSDPAVPSATAASPPRATPFFEYATGQPYDPLPFPQCTSFTHTPFNLVWSSDPEFASCEEYDEWLSDLQPSSLKDKTSILEPSCPGNKDGYTRLRGRPVLNHCYTSPIDDVAGAKSTQYILLELDKERHQRVAPNVRSKSPDPLIFSPSVVLPTSPNSLLPRMRRALERAAEFGLEENPKLGNKEHQGTAGAWIFKPDLGSRAQGITIWSHLSIVQNATLQTQLAQQRGLLQVYLRRPLLLNGFKHHLRFYVVTTSTDPAFVYLFKEGLYLPSQHQYPNDGDGSPGFSDMLAHLTNSALRESAATTTETTGTKEGPSMSRKHDCSQQQDTSDAAFQEKESPVANDRITRDDQSSFIPSEPATLSEYWHQLAVARPLLNITRMKATLTQRISHYMRASPTLIHRRSLSRCARCFEVHGVDIMFAYAASGQPLSIEPSPFLLEVNHDPELWTPGAPVNQHVHDSLLRSMVPFSIRPRWTKEVMQRVRTCSRKLKRPDVADLVPAVEVEEAMAGMLIADHTTGSSGASGTDTLLSGSWDIIFRCHEAVWISLHEESDRDMNQGSAMDNFLHLTPFDESHQKKRYPSTNIKTAVEYEFAHCCSTSNP